MKNKLSFFLGLKCMIQLAWGCDSTSQACPPAQVANYMMQQAQATGPIVELNSTGHPHPQCPPQMVLVQYRLTQTETSSDSYLQSRHIGGGDADCDGFNAFGWTGVTCKKTSAVSASNQYAYACQAIQLSTTQWLPSGNN